MNVLEGIIKGQTMVEAINDRIPITLVSNESKKCCLVAETDDDSEIHVLRVYTDRSKLTQGQESGGGPRPKNVSPSADLQLKSKQDK